MKRPRTFIRLISLFCALSLFAVQPGFAATKSVTKLKSAGRTANSIPNTILNGVSAPTKSIGINGDFYIDTKNLNIYGPKKNNAWPLPISLRGTAGTAGTDGKTGTPGVAGSDGKTITNTSTVSGTAGATGATGATGLVGAAGSNGAAGETGAAGASGSAGPAGPPGPAGSTGATGAAGASGTPGVSGVSTVSLGAFSFINTLTGTAGASAQSIDFGAMLPGKKYSIRLNISGSKASYGDLDTTLVLQVFSTAGDIPITTGYSVSSGKKFISPATIYSQNIIADLMIDGSLVTNPFNIFVKVSATEAISYVVSLNGYFALTEVGSIT
jgi:hypothetical protein